MQEVRVAGHLGAVALGALDRCQVQRPLARLAVFAALAAQLWGGQQVDRGQLAVCLDLQAAAGVEQHVVVGLGTGQWRLAERALAGDRQVVVGQVAVDRDTPVEHFGQGLSVFDACAEMGTAHAQHANRRQHLEAVVVADSFQDIGFDLTRAQGDLRDSFLFIQVQGDVRARWQDDAAAIAEQQADEGGRGGFHTFLLVDGHAFFERGLVTFGVDLPGIACKVQHARGQRLG